jgi:hypothetical protein
MMAKTQGNPFVDRNFDKGGPVGGSSKDTKDCTDHKYLRFDDGQTIKKIKIWPTVDRKDNVDKKEIDGLQAIAIWTSKDINEGKISPSYLFGTIPSKEKDAKEYTFAPGETMTELTIWANGNHQRCGGVNFKTNKGANYKVSMTDWPLKDGSKFIRSVGSGILVGIEVFYGNKTITALGFIFLKPLASSQLVDLAYPDLALYNMLIQPESLDTFILDNTKGVSPKNWDFSKKQSKEVSWSLSFKVGFEYGVSLTVNAGIPDIADVSGTVSWKISAEMSQSTTKTETKDLSWTINGTANPGERVDLTALTRHGSLDNLPFTGTLQLTTVDGSTFCYPVKGTMNCNDYTSTEVVSTDSFKALKKNGVNAEIAG